MKQRLHLIAAFLFFSVAAIAGDRYWVGGSGNWEDAAHWSLTMDGTGGAGIPTKNDHVFFDSRNGTTVTLIRVDGQEECASFTYGNKNYSSFQLLLSGKGTIHIFGDLELHKEFNDQFTGTWILTDPLADMRDNSSAVIRTNGHVFSGNFVFTPPVNGNPAYVVEDNLYVNNSIVLQHRAILTVNGNGKVIAKNLVNEDNSILTDRKHFLFNSSGPTGNNAARSAPPAVQSPLQVDSVHIVPNPCNGQCQATATVYASGGTPPYTYQWSNSQTGQTDTALCAGTYLVVVTDALGAQVAAFAIVTDPPPLVIFFNNTPANCNGQCNGSASASVAGGTPPYTYSWQPGNQTTSSISNQCAGTYTLTVWDSHACQVTQTTNVTQPSPLNPNGSSTNVTCNAACNGTASVSPSGGSPGYTYSWLPGNQTTPSISNLCPGSYTCTITDSHGCTASYTATITQPLPLTLSITHTNASCFGVCNGTATSTVTGGTIPYTYSWAPTGGNGPVASGLCAGTYTLTVTDANGCTITQQVTITQPPQLNVNPTGINISCFNACNGSASANASGGTIPYTYSWSTVPSQTTAVATNLCPGTYTVQVTDQNGCVNTGTITITQPLQLLANASGNNVTCFGGCNGSATANPSGGTGAYTYSWQPGNQTTQTITNLCAGTYTVTITDANGCTATQQVVITQPPQLLVNATHTNVTCNGACDGTATASPTGGTGAYTYSWQPGNQTTPTISGLCPGTYTITVTDANGCTATQNVTITQPNPLGVTVSSTAVSCNNACTATASASVSGGTAPYTYSWQPGNQTTASINNLCAGTYTVNVTDANGCTTNNTVTITQPTPFQVSTNVTNVSCNAQCNGAITVTVSGASPPYSYSWSPNGQTTSTINNLCAGTYVCTVTDAGGCDTTFAVVVTQPPVLQIGISSTNATCSGSCNGTATATPSGGTGAYTYSWSPGSQTTPSVNGLCAGSYTVTVTDANGCIATQTATITQPPPLSGVVTGTTSSCGTCNGSATISVSGGTSPYAYFWSPFGGTNPTATNLCPGTYTCTVTDIQGCTTTVTVTIVQVVNITITPSSSTPSCFGSCDAVASANAAGGQSPYTYVWQPGNVTSQNLTGLCAGSYTVTATDANGCFNTDTIVFTNPPQITATASFTNASCNGSCNGTASVTASGGTGAYTYSWSPGGQTTAAINGLCPGTYTCFINDMNGCDTVVSVTITEPSLIVANEVVTPANCTLCDGAISTAPSGGTGPYTYSWSPGAQTTSSINNLCPGIYTVTITDATGCSVVTQIAVSNLSGPTTTGSSTNTTCNGSCDGTASVTVTGGAGPFTYDWSPGNPAGDGTTDVTGLCAGMWFVQVTDAVGCITFQSYTITQPQPITASAVITHTSCNSTCDGAINASASGGTAPYTFTWSGPSSYSGSGATINNLCAGSYTCIITDASNCTATDTFVVPQPQPIVPNVTFTNVVCNGACNGTATSAVSGGTAPYSYSWSSGQLVPGVVNLCPGGYTLVITDADGCSAQQSITITEPPLLSSSITSTNVLCNGSCNGSAAVTASGGSPGYSYLWSPGSMTTSSVNGLCAGAYSVTTSDTNGCTSVQSITITQPNVLSLSSSANPASCFGACNGTASVLANGGTPGYTYSWSPVGGSNPTATSLCANLYTVTVTDANGCSQTATSNVTQPAQLLANVSFTSPQCNAACNGSATSNPIGGTGPYSYLWAPGGETTQTITNLCAGTYTVTVHDANGCTDVQTVNVTPPGAITISNAIAPANCGACDGTITVTPSGGTSPYTYSWSGGLPAQPNQVNLCAGLYTVVITDATSCVDTFIIALNNSGGPTGETVVTTPVTCPGSCDGTADVTPIGGTSPYSYVWNPGNQTTNVLAGMCAGNYFLQVTDSNGCIRFSPVTINSPPPINGNPFVTNATCTGICDGAVTLNPTGGTGAYTYSWSPGAQTTSSISGQCVGSYTCTITDANGCTATSTSTVNPWNTLTGNITFTPPNCANSCDATATVNISSGTPPFSYQWTDPLGQTSQTATGLCAGTYSVTVSDAGACSTMLQVTISSGPTPITINPSITPTTCNQCNGSVTLNASGGTAPYSYTWSNGAPTSTVNNLCAGVYNVTITDATGCSATFTINISSSGGPTAANETVTNASCNGVCDGSVTLAPSGGIPPYSYLWVPSGQTTSSVSGLCAGNYSVQIRDSAGCILTQNITITEPSAIVPNQVITNTPCGMCVGSIMLSPTGGTGPYTYSWSPGAQTTPTITNLCAGIYTVTITDATGCSHVVAIPVSNFNTGMTLTTAGTDISCNGSCNGTASVSVSGGNAPYSYNWSNGGITDTITALCAGNYVVQVTDGAGCISSAQFTVTQPPTLTGSFLFVQNELCTGACNGFITAIPSGGTMPYTYTWSNAQTTQTATNLCAGIYTVTVTDANGCSFQQQDTIVSPVVIILGVPNVTNASCNTTPDGAISISVSGGTTPYTFSWTGPNNYTSSSQNISNILAGTYTFSVTDANGCSAGDTVIVIATTTVIADAGNDTTFCELGSVILNGSGSVNATSYQWFMLPGMIPVSNTMITTVNPPVGSTTYILVVTNGTCTDTDTIVVTSVPLPVVDAGPDVEIITGQTVVIGGNPTGPSGSIYAWGPGTGLGDPTQSNPVAGPSTTTTYTVTVTDANGCTGSDTMTVTVVPEIKFPDGFSPNGDGTNDVWVIDNIQLFPNCNVQVYNRWGELLFNSTGYTTPWDGRYKGKDLPVGTYYYIIKLNDPLFPQVYTGPITIMR